MKRIVFIFTVLSFIIFVNCASKGFRQMIKTGQHSKKIEMQITKTVAGQYLLYLPESYPTNKGKWPLMFFLHGAGERGDSIALVKTHGPPKIVQHKKDFPFILISPQCPKGDRWSSPNQLDLLTALLGEIVSTYRVDTDRIYLTGLSMGGYGTWSLALKHPNKFAAIVPICGGGDPNKVCEIKHVPTWVFHGAKDKTVPIERSEEMVDALNACNGNVKFTVYPEAEHDSWTETYHNPELYTWLLKYSLKKRNP